jgi:general secretion pathway protein G
MRSRGQCRQAIGLTLIEVIFLLFLVATIAGLVGSPCSCGSDLERPNADLARVQMANLKQALDLYKLENGYYPETEQGLNALVAPPAMGRQAANFRPGGYLKDGQVPLDPWGNEFGYIGDNDVFAIFSAGSDGAIGAGDDIVELGTGVRVAKAR